jgi:YD repeat-containing protein
VGSWSKGPTQRGRSVHFGFDPRGSIQSREVFETGQSIPISWDYFYYNDNGELTWSDGPRYNPEDYVWRDYDGGGRKIQEIHWRSEAKSDGTGVQAPADNALYASSFNQWDPFGNLVKTVDPVGNYSLKFYDAIGQLKREEFYATNATLLATNGFSYNLAGDVTNAFNALGGSMQKLFNARGQPKFQRNFDGSTNGWLYYADGRLRREIQRNGAYWETTYDDANRKTTKIFYSAGSPLATNSTVLDRRGNIVQRADEGFNLFTNLFDGLDRLKVAAGPPVVTISVDPIFNITTTTIVQQVTTYLYTNSSKLLTVSNALGEKTVTVFDALDRPTSVQILPSGSANPVRITTTAYSADHHSVTVTNGSGANAIASTSYDDNDGHPLLSITYPYSNVREFTFRQYDLAGNLVYEDHESATNSSAPKVFSVASYVYDGLNRLTVKSDRDAALTYFYRDAAGNVTNQVMPGGVLKWQATYNNASQILAEWNLGSSGAGTRTNTYAYFPSGDPLAGLLQSRTDSLGIIRSYDYDDFLRVIETYDGLGPFGPVTFWT